MDKRSLIFVILVTAMIFLSQYFLPSQKSEPPKETIQKEQSTASLEQSTALRQDEKFYVLENEYQQLVFSNYGGAIAEINLPLAKKNNKSVIKATEIDLLMQSKYPQNDYFPMHVCQDYKGNIIHKGHLGEYYPLLRRTQDNFPTQFYALQLSSERENLHDVKYDIASFDKNTIVFTAQMKNRKITKTYTLQEKAPYFFDVGIDIQGDKKDIWITTGINEVELSSNKSIPSMKMRFFSNSKAKMQNIKIPSKPVTVTEKSISPDWLCSSNGFLGMIMDPLTKIDSGYQFSQIPGTVVPSRITLIDAQYNVYPAKNFPGYAMYLPLSTIKEKNQLRIFAGPFQRETLKLADQIYANPLENYNPDYIASQNQQGFFAFISAPFVKFLLLIMNFFYYITHSWGFSIILLTIFLRLLLYPLNTWSIKSNERMQTIGPKIKLLQERYKKDPKKLQMEMMKIYREEKVNPFSGCFPLLIQLPFLIGLFDLLKTSFDLRGASFIPGWIDNLNSPDVLFSWNAPIFFFGTQFHLLPFLTGIVMFIQQKMTMKTPKDKALLSDQQKQQKMMGMILPIFITFIFYKMPSGLNIYFFTSTLLGILQQWIIQKKTNSPKLKRVK